MVWIALGYLKEVFVFSRSAVFLFFFLTASTCIGQQNQRHIIDSFYTLLESAKKSDTNKVKLLNNYARIIRFDSVDKAMSYAEKALDISKKLKEEYWTAQSYYSKGMIFSKLSNYEKAINYFDSSQSIFRKLNKTTSLLSCLNIKAESYKNLGKYSLAIDMFHNVITLAGNISNIEQEGIAYGNIGNIYSDIEMYKEAISNYEKALERFRILNDTLFLGLVIQNIAYSYLGLKEFQEAKLKYDSAIFLFNNISRSDAAAWAKGNQALVLANLKQYKLAWAMLKESNDAAVVKKNKKMLAVNNIIAARIILLMGENIQNKDISYTKALLYAEKGLEQAKEIGNIRQQAFALETLSEIHDRLKNFSKAMENYKFFTVLKDSFSGANKTQEIAIKEMQFLNDAKESVLNAEHRAKVNWQITIRNLFIIGTAIIIVSSLLLFFSYKRRRDENAKRVEAELKAEISDTEMKALRSQMNPHFIFSSLNSISDYISKNKTDIADKYLTKFAKLMRLVLENSEKKEVSLSEDLKALELYMQLESLRLNNKFSYDIVVDENIDKDNTLVPPLLMQPFVENSIWHGIANKQGQGKILVKVKRENNLINCIVEDDGIGRVKASTLLSQNIISEKKSMGIRITSERIKILNKIKNSSAEIKFSDLPQGTKVEVKLPLELSF